MTPVAMGEYPDPPERTTDDMPSGLPEPEPEEAPLGVPADSGDEPPGPEAMPGIPTEGEPPSSG
jgi:hypothetical protein